MPDHFFVYPAYLGRHGTRAHGRRVPQLLAANEVTLEQLLESTRRLGFQAEAEPEKAYPRDPLSAGRLRVQKKPGTTKAAFLRQLATALRDLPPRKGKA
ncbi:MAG: signal recognition particle subunit SRP19/SEC65 family protein [Thermoplasmata archaeon]|nr:signal recognition particle subunit SRP19/SEC65 family protein [Thermoplasmata archaeon]MCI4341764.1 signal recognition particle subunit SRP19/SEC65 family protein [Thermoplasmata archaeon]